MFVILAMPLLVRVDGAPVCQPDFCCSPGVLLSQHLSCSWLSVLWATKQSSYLGALVLKHSPAALVH